MVVRKHTIPTTCQTYKIQFNGQMSKVYSKLSKQKHLAETVFCQQAKGKSVLNNKIWWSILCSSKLSSLVVDGMSQLCLETHGHFLDIASCESTKLNVAAIFFSQYFRFCFDVKNQQNDDQTN